MARPLGRKYRPAGVPVCGRPGGSRGPERPPAVPAGWRWRRYCRAMRFGIPGPLTVADGERPIAVPGAKPRALLVLLVLHAGRVMPSDRRGV